MLFVRIYFFFDARSRKGQSILFDARFGRSFFFFFFFLINCWSSVVASGCVATVLCNLHCLLCVSKI